MNRSPLTPACRASRILAQDSSKPVCPNCQQWQSPGQKGHLDCVHDCAARGFAPKAPNPDRSDPMRGTAPRSELRPKRPRGPSDPGATTAARRAAATLGVLD